jgi:hypothetical protein
MSNCTGDLKDSAGIEACAPVVHSDRSNDAMQILDGTYEVVNVSSTDLDKFPDPFAGQKRGEEDGAGLVGVSLSVVVVGLSVGLMGLI